jgi:hypothetical protein
VKISEVRDFRTVKRFKVDGGEGRPHRSARARADRVPRGVAHRRRVQLHGRKYGRSTVLVGVAHQRRPRRAQRRPRPDGPAARRTEEYFATGLFVGVSGPDGTFFSNVNKNVINTTNGAASDQPGAVGHRRSRTALKVLANQVDADGEPIAIDMVHLVVPPALMVQARTDPQRDRDLGQLRRVAARPAASCTRSTG